MRLGEALLKLCFVCTAPITAESFYPGLLRRLLERGHEPTLICGASYTLPADLDGRVRKVVIPMSRGPAPVTDVLALVRLWLFFLRNRFDVVRYSTPKASLLGALASFAGGQRKRIYMVRGSLYEPDAKGLRLFDRLEPLISALSTIVVPVGRDLGGELAASGRAPAGKIILLGHGSSMGVDLTRFSPTPQVEERARAVRDDLGIGPDDLMVLILARLARGKGVDDAVEAFQRVSARFAGAHLVVAGGLDEREPLEPSVLERIDADPRIHRVGRISDTPAYHAAADINLFPTRREGLPNVVLEAGAMGVPVITCDVDGAREPVLDGVSGILAPPRDPAALAAALERLAADPALRQSMGLAARTYIAAHYDTEYVLGEAVRLLEAVGEGREDDASFVRPWAQGMVASPPRSS